MQKRWGPPLGRAKVMGIRSFRADTKSVGRTFLAIRCDAPMRDARRSYDLGRSVGADAEWQGIDAAESRQEASGSVSCETRDQRATRCRSFAQRIAAGSWRGGVSATQARPGKI